MSPASAAAEEWRTHGSLVLACFCGFFFFSMLTASMSVFMGPLGDEFGWSRTLLASGISIASVTTALLSPFFGILLDRYGARRLALPGLVVTALAIASMSLASGSPLQWLFLWTVYAVISISVKTTVWTSAVSGVFSASRGLALGVTLAGTAVAQTVIPPLANWLISDFGWRVAYVVLGLGWGSITLLLCSFFLYDARDPVPTASAGEDAPRTPPVLTGLSVAEAWRSSALWRIGASTFVMMLLTIGLLIHQIAILTEAGVSRANAAWLASLAGGMGIVGKLVTGLLLDRHSGSWVGGLTLGATALAFAFLIDGVHTPLLIGVAMLVNGYTAGAKLQIASYLTVRYGGMRHFGKIYGTLTSLVALGSGLGPLVAGWVYDFSGDYGGFLLAGAIGSVVSGLLVFTLPAYPDWSPRTGETADGRDRSPA